MLDPELDRRVKKLEERQSGDGCAALLLFLMVFFMFLKICC